MSQYNYYHYYSEVAPVEPNINGLGPASFPSFLSVICPFPPPPTSPPIFPPVLANDMSKAEGAEPKTKGCKRSVGIYGAVLIPNNKG